MTTVTMRLYFLMHDDCTVTKCVLHNTTVTKCVLHNTTVTKCVLNDTS